MAQPTGQRYQWQPIAGLVLAANLLAVLLFGTWVNAYNPALSPLYWFTR